MPRDPAPASVIIHPFWAAAKVVRLPPSPSLSSSSTKKNELARGFALAHRVAGRARLRGRPLAPIITGDRHSVPRGESRFERQRTTAPLMHRPRQRFPMTNSYK